MATVASHKRLYTHYQRDGIDNHTYHREFLSFVETIETYGGLGAVGVIPVFLNEKIIELYKQGLIANASAPTDEERALAVGAVREEYLAALMISGANRDRFSLLRTDLQNQYGYGNDLYPKTTDQCLSLLNRWTVAPSRTKRADAAPTAPVLPKQEDSEALVFAQNDSKSAPPSRGDNSSIKRDGKDSRRSLSSSASSSSSGRQITNVQCKTCGRMGHTSLVCPYSKRPPDQIHAMDADDASEASNESSVIILAQLSDEPIAQNQQPINKDFVLLDSQSTVNLFSNPSHVTNIRPADSPIRVYCNKGTMITDKQADFGDNNVYFDANGIANVLSLFHLSKKYHITYDSRDREGVFRVFTDNGIVEFMPTAKGLHVLNLNDNPEAACLLAIQDSPITSSSDHHLHVNTVRENYEGFTKHQVKNAARARRLMSMVGTPSPRDFQGMVRHNLLKDCPVTPEDVENANTIFGPDLATIRGKTVRNSPERVVTDYVEIPRIFFEKHHRITIVADIMFVNSVPFLVSASRRLNLITIEHAPQRTASKIAYLLQRIIRVHNRAGFTVQMILMDNEFEKVRHHLHETTLNIPAAGEHVAEIERRIRVIKERSRGIINTLPYLHFPQIMMINLLHFIVMWLNNFPSNTGISSRWSPREIVLRHRLDYKHHCRAPFGAYCEVHEDHEKERNSMKTRGLPSICLGPTGNKQGTYNFLNLVSGLVVKRRTWNELPVPQSVIDRVSKLAKNSGVSKDLIFADRHRQPYTWPDNPPDSLDDTQIGAYPDVSAELPGVLLDRSPPGVNPPDVVHDNDPDWTALADAALDNADLDIALPPSPDIVDLSHDDEDDPSPLPSSLRQTLQYIPKLELTASIPVAPPSLPLRPATLPVNAHHPNTSMTFISTLPSRTNSRKILHIPTRMLTVWTSTLQLRMRS